MVSENVHLTVAVEGKDSRAKTRCILIHLHIMQQTSVGKDEEDQQENLVVENFIETLPIKELKKLVSVKYKCGVGSMEFTGRCTAESVLQEDAQQRDIQSNDPNLP
ncbi:uncharacterized protein LOC135683960 [Rhopilema esculentum]|uniref:uncharacterized protein LOC135683960 n=1 Tax=Rhopilema esculentum TaxID=499914 RepID=UPI0031E18FBD